MPEFTSRDPRTPGFWDERFEHGFTPWDRGGVPRAFQDFVEQAGQPLQTLIPGCGAAYELAFLRERGWDATAIDFSPSAVALARRSAPSAADRIVQADFFSYQPAPSLQLIYERAFLCAMPRAMWPDVAARWAGLLPAGGLLAGYFFFDHTPKGPPFGATRDVLEQLLLPHFDCVADAPVADSIEVFAGKERWMIWRRR